MKIIVIGNGLYGAGIAFLLQEAGTDTLLVGPLTSKPKSATKVSGGLLRVVDPDLSLARLALSGVDMYRSWEELRLPGSCGYEGCGALIVAREAEATARLKEAAELGNLRYPIEPLSNTALQMRFPAMTVASDAVAFFEPFGGYGSPELTRCSLIEGLLRCGGHYRKLDTLAVESSNTLVASNGRTTTQIKADAFVIAAGRSSISLLECAGFRPRNQNLLIPRTIAVPHFQGPTVKEGCGLPVLVDYVHNTFLRPLSDDRVLVGAGNDGDEVAEGVEPSLNNSHIEDARRRIASTFGDLQEAPHAGGDVGVDMYTPTLQPIVGPLSMRPELFLAAGFSGRGYKISFPISAHIAKSVLYHHGIRPTGLLKRILVDEKEIQQHVIPPDSVFNFQAIA